MTAIAELRKKAAEKFESFTIEFESETVQLKNLLNLNEKEMKAFTDTQKALTELDDEEAEVDAVRTQFVDCLVTVAEDKRKARKLLGGESIAVLMAILEEYGASAADAAKSDRAE